MKQIKSKTKNKEVFIGCNWPSEFQYLKDKIIQASIKKYGRSNISQWMLDHFREIFPEEQGGEK